MIWKNIRKNIHQKSTQYASAPEKQCWYRSTKWNGDFPTRAINWEALTMSVSYIYIYIPVLYIPVLYDIHVNLIRGVFLMIKNRHGMAWFELDMLTARRRLKSPRSVSGTSAHPTMVTLVNITVMNGWLTSLKLHVNRPPHSSRWDNGRR